MTERDDWELPASEGGDQGVWATKYFSVFPPEVNDNSMKLMDAQMDLLVPACEERLSRHHEACLVEFEEATERTFMPYIRTQLKVFDAEGGFFALPRMGIFDNNSAQVEKALPPHSDNETPALEDSVPLRVSMSTDVAFDGELGKLWAV